MRLFRPGFAPIRAARTASVLTIVGAALLLAGCAYKPIEPWVKPYERERLADPVMRSALNDLPGRQQDHVYTVREGSRGATGVQGGGCGCN
jgi:uncharacterized lipoprotein YajG